MGERVSLRGTVDGKPTTDFIIDCDKKARKEKVLAVTSQRTANPRIEILLAFNNKVALCAAAV
jgi:hypothetical protein